MTITFSVDEALYFELNFWNFPIIFNVCLLEESARNWNWKSVEFVSRKGV